MQLEPSQPTARRLPIGAEWISERGVHFRVWAPEHERVAVAVEGRPPLELSAEPDGYFSGLAPDLAAGADYAFLLDADPKRYPDPASRFQPRGPHGPSRVIDPARFRFSDNPWRGVSLHAQTLYELHVGTFTEAGTWEAARRRLPHLRDLGVSVIEVMPVAEFAGEFGWGYDGVLPFAPYHGYGTPDEFRAFVDHAHQLGLGVILDVVYNHFGPEGNYLGVFSPYYLAEHATEWGQAINYDGEGSQPVREFVRANAVYWISEFRLDGLRLDATQTIVDTSEEHIVAELTRSARAAAGERSLLIVAEDEQQRATTLREAARGGHGLDAIWNDDFHHSARVALTGHREAYYTDYLGSAAELAAAAKYGFLYQGQYYSWQRRRRGETTRGLAPNRFIAFLENHDQVSNSADGARLSLQSHAAELRALTSLLLLGPWTPMLFQGQEWQSTASFAYFADMPPELATHVNRGRREFLSQFPSIASRAVQERVPNPEARTTFERAKLDWSKLDSAQGRAAFSLHRDLLHLRRHDPVIATEPDLASFDAVALTERCLALRWFSAASDDRLLLVNLGADLDLAPMPEPRLAPPTVHGWSVLFASEDPRYGGGGHADQDPFDAEHFTIPGRSALLLAPARSRS